jgi:hypothetical protein
MVVLEIETGVWGRLLGRPEVLNDAGDEEDGAAIGGSTVTSL